MDWCKQNPGPKSECGADVLVIVASAESNPLTYSMMYWISQVHPGAQEHSVSHTMHRSLKVNVHFPFIRVLCSINVRQMNDLMGHPDHQTSISTLMFNKRHVFCLIITQGSPEIWVHATGPADRLVAIDLDLPNTLTLRDRLYFWPDFKILTLLGFQWVSVLNHTPVISTFFVLWI